MALSQEVIEAEAKPSAAPKAAGVSSRPLWLGLGVAALLLVVALTVALSDSKKAEAKKDEKSGLLVPNRRVVAELEQAAADRAAQQPSATQGNLGVTQGPVPPVPNVGPAADLGAPATAEAYKAASEAQLMAHALELQKWQLGLQKEAFAASSSAPAFTEWKKQQAAQMGRLMGGLDSEDDEALMAGGGGASAFMEAAAPSLALLSASRGAGGGLGNMAGLAMASSPTANGADPQMSGQKLSFFQQGGAQLEPGVLDSSVRQKTTPYEIQMGTVIPGVMISGIHSEAPGQIIGQVSENVYDSATGRHLLIPQGCRLVGTYNAVIAQGQYRVQVAWVRLNFPDGSSIDLGGMSGADQSGTSGFEDKVNRHFARRLAAALMTSSFNVAYELTAPRNGNQMEGAVHRGLGESLVQLGADMARQESQLPPTLEIRAGYRFLVHVSKDIRFPGPYDDGIDRNVRRR